MTNIKLIWILFAVTLSLVVTLGWQNQKLVTPSAPLGIISLEFSNNATGTSGIRAEWSGDLRTAFYIHIVIDYFLIFFYGLFLYFTCLYFSMLFPETSKMGNIAAFCSITAAGLDAIANVFMLISITLGVSGLLSFATSTIVYFKYALLLIAVAYILTGVLRQFFNPK